MKPFLLKSILAKYNSSQNQKPEVMEAGVLFPGRIYDFSKPQLLKNLKNDKLEAYEQFYPGFCMGYKGDSLVVTRIGKSGSGEKGLFLDLDIEKSPWLTLEVSLNSEIINKNGMALAMLEASSVPSTNCEIVLRTPSSVAPNGYIDSQPMRFVLNNQLRQMPFFFTDLDPIRINEKFKDSRIIIFFQKRNLSIHLKKFLLMPVAH